MTTREHLTEAAKHLWAIYEDAALLDSFSELVAVRSTIDEVLSKLEYVDSLEASNG